jgi:hypothetical protein
VKYVRLKNIQTKNKVTVYVVNVTMGRSGNYTPEEERQEMNSGKKKRIP